MKNKNSEKELYYINFTNELTDVNSVYVEMQHDFTHTSYWTASVVKDNTVHYRPYFQSYHYTVAVYRADNGTEGPHIASFQYACCKDASVTITIHGTSSKPSFTVS